MILDFSNQAHYILALLPEAILTVLGMVLLILGVAGPKGGGGREASALGWWALGGLLLAGLANGWLYGVTEATTAGMIAVDRYRLFSNWILLLAALLSVLISSSYVVKQRLQAAEFYALIIFSTVGMMLMAAGRDLIVIFLGLEVMSIAVYSLAALNRRDRRSAEAGLKYFILGAFSTGFFLYGIALVYGATGSTNLAAIAEGIDAGSFHQTLLVVGVLLIAAGFAFKVSAVPFHMWTPDVYEGSPAPVTAFMSAAVKAASFVAFLRVFLVGFHGVYESWGSILWWLAVVTMIAANLVALVQGNVKRLLAYSSIAHAGYLMVALVAANETAAAGLLFYLLVYALMNIGAFAIVISVAHQGEERLRIEDYTGLGWQQPLLGVVFTIFLLSLAGFPGTGGFVGKIFLLQGVAEARLWSLAVVLVLTTVISYWYYLRIAWYMWMRDAASEKSHARVYAPLGMKVALFVGVGLILLTGIFPGGALEFARSSVEGFGWMGSAMGVLP